MHFQMHGNGRALAATLVTSVAVIIGLSACSSSVSSDGSDAIKAELTIRGFDKVNFMSFDPVGGGYLFNVSAGVCRGTVKGTGQYLTANFTGSDGKQYSVDNPTKTLVFLVDRLKYCSAVTTPAPSKTN